MGIEFLARARRVTLSLTLVTALAAGVYVDLGFGVAVLLGSLWSLANLLWIESAGGLAFSALQGESPSRRSLLRAFAGLPLLLLGGWAAVASSLPLLALTLGFWILYAVVVLKTLGILLARALDFATGRSREPARVAVRRPLPSNRVMGLVGWGVAAMVAGGLVLWAAASPEAPEAAGGIASAAAEESGHGEGAARGPEGAGDDHGDGVPHLPTVTGILHGLFPDSGIASFLYRWEDLFFALLAAVILVVLVRIAFARPTLVPGRAQALVELVAEGMRDFVVGTFGPHMERYVPFLGTLFLYILVMNWMGMVPFLKSSTANLNTTLAMALVVFVYAQYTAIREQGLGGYLHHLAGEPRNLFGWGVALLLFPIELMGEFIKPVSLAARLFGNIFGEDLLIAVFIGIGAVLMSWQPVPVGFPVHVLFMALGLVMSAVQALVFALLAAVYLYMAQPQHEEEEHPGAEESGAVPAHA